MYSFAELRVMGGSDVLMAPQGTKHVFFMYTNTQIPFPDKDPLTNLLNIFMKHQKGTGLNGLTWYFFIEISKQLLKQVADRP